MILCKDCRHCLPTRHYQPSELGGREWETYEDARCARTDLVTGTGEAGRLCADERAGAPGFPHCGITAAFFEARP